MSDAARLLDAWEQALSRSAVQRALILLAVACPDMTEEARAALPIGRRDARLLSLRERCFGSTLISLAACPHCGERVELTLHTAELRVDPPGDMEEPIALTVGQHAVRFRLPNSRDVAALTEDAGRKSRQEADRSLETAVEDFPAPDPQREPGKEADAGTSEADCAGNADANSPARKLLARCLLGVERQGRPITSESLPPDVIDAITDAMSRADPQADIRLALTCPACGQAWQATFDIAAYLWAEVHAWAERALREVHALASAYGWSEAAILAMTATRRRLYLEMING